MAESILQHSLSRVNHGPQQAAQRGGRILKDGLPGRWRAVIGPTSVGGMKRSLLCLIDANNYMHRAFHALPSLSTSGGLPTNAVLGFATMLRKLLDERQPDYCAAIFDAPGPNVRHQEYSRYKSSRPPTAEELKVQFPYIKRVCEAFRIPMLEAPGFEADDLIATLARLAEGRGLDSLIVSGDKDLLQVVSLHTVQLSEGRAGERIYDPAAVEEKYGVPPQLIPDLFGLMGDSVDDIPGVPGIGPKRARELLQTYGSMEGAIEHAGELSRYKYGRDLAEHADQAVLSKQLATIREVDDVPLDLDALRTRDPDRGACRELFMELEFRRLLDSYAEAPTHSDVEYRTIANRSELRDVVAQIREAGRFALHLQPDSHDPASARIVGIGLAWKAGEACYVPLGHSGLTATNATEPGIALSELEEVCADERIELVGHDLKYASRLLACHELGLAPRVDVMLASYVLHPTRASHALDALAADFLQLQMVALKDILPDRRSGFNDVPVPEATRYVGERVESAFRLAAQFEVDLATQASLSALFYDLEMPLLQVLLRMELRGVGLDVPYLQQMSQRFSVNLGKLEAAIYDDADGPFNLNSPKQLAEVLFDRLGLPSGGKTAKSGSRSTRAEVLETLAAEHAVVRNILEYRELSKLKSTYLEALPARVSPRTGRVHASFDQAVAATGRLASSNPNLQNIPTRSATGRQIRRAFMPAAGHMLMAADYSQIELRIMASLAKDPTLTAAFVEGRDIHRATAAEIFGVELEDVTYEQRDRAKVINFGVLYGMGPQRLAREFGISVAEARAFIERYLGAFEGVGKFIARTIAEAKDRGYVTTLLGRVRHLPELQSSRPMLRSFGERIAVNTPVQGTAADLIKLAMVNIDRRLISEKMDAGMTIQVHDELVLEVPHHEIDQVTEIVRTEMESAIQLDVPLVVEIGMGPNWMEAKGQP